jgi:hypothetical protein
LGIKGRPGNLGSSQFTLISSSLIIPTRPIATMKTIVSSRKALHQIYQLFKTLFPF